MMTKTTAPDAALLWARNEWPDDADDSAHVQSCVAAFRAGQSHADAGLLEAIAGPNAWLDSWAQHVGNCQGGYVCTCGLVRARSELSAAIAAAKGDDQ